MEQQERTFTIDEARRELEAIGGRIDELIGLRADLAETAHAHNEGGDVTLADAKAMEARLSELLDDFRSRGIQVKGWAPLLLDFPAEHDGRQVLLCWVEGEPALRWYHELAVGFAGRRRIEELVEGGA